MRPSFLALWEGKGRGGKGENISVQGQPGTKLARPHLNQKARNSWTPVAHVCAIQEAEIRRLIIQNQLRQMVHETVSRKYPSQKKRLVE
jgi:hypothetical protein